MAGTAGDLQLRELKDTVNELNKLIRTLQETIAAANAREAELQQKNDNLRQQVDYLTKKLFGRSSEKKVISRGTIGSYPSCKGRGRSLRTPEAQEAKDDKGGEV